jgi:hypothetical protein
MLEKTEREKKNVQSRDTANIGHKTQDKRPRKEEQNTT